MEATSRAQSIQQYGPYGRQVPLTFNLVLDSTDRIKTITLSTGSVVDGIGFEIVDKSGTSKSVWYGGHGHESTTIYFKDTEYITQISGSYGNFAGDGNYNMDVAQIYIHTNLSREGYGPYGRMKDCKNIKSFKAPDSSSTGPIVGFFGATGGLVQSLGISVSKAQSIQRYGPYGRPVPLTFDFVLDRTDRIKSITLSTGSVVDGLGFKIVNQSGTSKSVWYGGRGHESATINLTDTEYITQISGSYGNFAGDGNYNMDVAQIYIHTNLAPNGYGPYGRMKDCKNIKSFKVPDSSSAGHIVGFFGATGICLQSLGISVRKNS